MFCDLKFTSQQGLLKHIESQHSGSTLQDRKNVPCTYPGCGKKFTKQNNLNTHIRSAHMGERYICGSFDVSAFPDVSHFESSDGCGTDFVSKANLVDHIRTAHLKLPSLINANRIKSVKTEPEDDGYVPPKKSKKKSKKQKASAMDELLGMSYAADPKRTIPCIAPGCPHMFTRDYDLQVHLQSAHPYEAPSYDPASSTFNTNFLVPESEPNVGMGTGFTIDPALDPQLYQPGVMYDQADIDWELQRQALEGGPFWVGADQAGNAFQNPDEWTQEQLEMRRLIG